MSYIDFKLIEQYPNKYGFTPKNIKTVQILDWDKLKKKTWYNEAMKKTGHWWCHIEGCEPAGGKKFGDEDDFWVGFREEDNKIDCKFSCYEGMCHYRFNRFYDAKEIDNPFDMCMQVNTIKYLNQLVDEGIISKPEVKK